MQAADRRFPGGVFSAAIDGGRAGATVSVHRDAVVAVTAEGQEFRVAFRECQLELGGASGKMWFCRTPDRSVTIFCEAPGFRQALEQDARAELGPAIERLSAQARAHGHKSFWVWTAVLAGAVLLLGAAILGIRHAARGSVDVLPRSVDAQLGDLALEHMDLQGEVIEDPVLGAAVSELVERLAPGKKRDGFTLRVQVVDAPIVNAFALPGGAIVVYTGLLRAAESPEQVAGVLAHEIAHVTERHGMQRIAQSAGVVAGIQLLFGDVSGLSAIAVQVLTEGAINSYSREHEHEADMIGVRMLAKAHIDPRALAEFFALLQRRHGDLPSAVAWLGTHPQLGDRIRAVRAEAERVGPANTKPLALDWKEVRRKAGAVDDAAKPATAL